MADTSSRQQDGGNQGENPQSKLDREMVRWTRAVAIFTFFLVATSAVSDWFIYQQLKVANDAQIDTREQLRAVVSFVGFAPLGINDKDGKISNYLFRAQFQNSGGTRTAQ